jgi:hypothetical protein
MTLSAISRCFAGSSFLRRPPIRPSARAAACRQKCVRGSWRVRTRRRRDGGRHPARHGARPQSSKAPDGRPVSDVGGNQARFGAVERDQTESDDLRQHVERSDEATQGSQSARHWIASTRRVIWETRDPGRGPMWRHPAPQPHRTFGWLASKRMLGAPAAGVDSWRSLPVLHSSQELCSS